MTEVVTNTSPLLYLHRLGRFDLLRLLFGKLIVPSQVEQELDQGRGLGRDVPDVHQTWIEIRKAAVAHEYAGLGPGESGALDLARALPDSIAILDDGAARVWAGRLGLRFAGTVGILAEAKRRGHLPQVRTELNRLAELGFRMAPSLRQRVLVGCGEE